MTPPTDSEVKAALTWYGSAGWEANDASYRHGLVIANALKASQEQLEIETMAHEDSVRMHLREKSRAEAAEAELKASEDDNQERGQVIQNLEAELKQNAIRIRELETANKMLREALEMLYEETKDYITINNLGDPHHNQSMKLAKQALSKPAEENENSNA